MGFRFAEQWARRDRWCYQIKSRQMEVETVWVLTRLTAAKADAARLFEWARLYWSLENGLHFRLDVSAGEDECWVRHPIAATVYGLLRRATQEMLPRLGQTARDRTYPTFQAKMKNRVSRIIRYLNGDLKATVGNGLEYIDASAGTMSPATANALDSRFSLPPMVCLFNDGDDDENSTVCVNSIQIREFKMADEEVAALGGPSA
jgi:hypothetical protein